MNEQRIPIEQLKLGLFIRLGLKWYEHPFLFGSFKITRQRQIDAIRNLGITHVICVTEKSDIPLDAVAEQVVDSSNGNKKTSSQEPEELRDPEKQAENTVVEDVKQQRIEAIKKQRKRFQNIEKNYNQTISQVRSLMQNLLTGSEESVEQAGKLIQGMVETLLSDQEVLVQLMNSSSGDENVFFHTLNVAVLSLMLGKQIGLDADEMQLLGMGALFHDIGKSRIPKKILYKEDPLTTAEKQFLYLHPKYGVEIISRVPAFPEQALEVVSQHHERMDGKGYPGALKGEAISRLARVAAIANTYDNHVNKMNIEQSLTPHEAISLMFRRQKHWFDQSMLPYFIRGLGVYPPGTIVQLTNKMIGMVVAINARCQLKPNVLIYDEKVPKKEAAILDLSKEQDLAIYSSIRPGKLPQDIYNYLSPRTQVSYYLEPGAKKQDK